MSGWGGGLDDDDCGEEEGTGAAKKPGNRTTSDSTLCIWVKAVKIWLRSRGIWINVAWEGS